jgi:hypothetical protein
LGKHWTWTVSVDYKSELKGEKQGGKSEGGQVRGVIDFALIQDNFCSFSTQGIVGSNYLLICMVLEMCRNNLLKDCDLLNIFSFKLCEKNILNNLLIKVFVLLCGFDSNLRGMLAFQN